MVSEDVANKNPSWFQMYARTVREIVVSHGGAIAMTREELHEAVREENPAFSECPSAVLDHPTLPLNKWAGLEVSSFGGRRPDILLIRFSNIPEAKARAKCKSNGLSENVEIALLERSTA